MVLLAGLFGCLTGRQRQRRRMELRRLLFLLQFTRSASRLLLRT